MKECIRYWEVFYESTRDASHGEATDMGEGSVASPYLSPDAARRTVWCLRPLRPGFSCSIRRGPGREYP